MAGSAPAGYSTLQGEVASSLYQQQLLQQLQMVQQQQQLSQQQQQQLLSDQLALQQQLQNFQYMQQSGMGPGSGQQQAGYQQLLQQQLATQQQQHQQQQLQQWKSLDQLQQSGSLPVSQQLAASTPSSQLIWMQQQQQQLRMETAMQHSAGMHGSSLASPNGGPLAAALAAQNSHAMTSTASAPAFPGHSLSNSWQPYGAGAGAGGGSGGQPGMIKWSSSILSKQRPLGGMEGGPSAASQGLVGPPLSGGRSNSLVNMAGMCADVSAAAGMTHSEQQSSSRTPSGDGGKGGQMEQLNGLMQLCRVTSPGVHPLAMQ
jgi:hypothetical protein